MEVLIFLFSIIAVAMLGAVLGGVYAIYASRQND